MIRTLLIATLTCLAYSTSAYAQQAYPSKPIRFISPFAPGGGNDIISRAVAHKLSENVKQQVIVDNRPGANGIIGTELAARSAPDGYTVVLIPSGHAVNASLHRKLPYDSIKDFTPITLVGSSPLILAVHPSLPVKNVKGLVAFAKARPGQLTYGSAGIGSSGHLGGALFEVLTGAKMVHVPYKGMSLAITDVIAGQVSLVFGTSASVMQHARSGRMRALATTGARRAAALPDLPTVAEAGVPGYEAGLWYGFVGPARIPPDIVRRLNAEVNVALSLPDVRERLTQSALQPVGNTPAQFAAVIRTEIERWTKVARELGIKPE